MPELTIRGTIKEQQVFTDVNQHYDMARQDLEKRYPDWRKKLQLFRSHIDESSWPYSSEIFVPQTFTAIFEKMARLNGGKPRGRLIPREGGDAIKAKINNELLNFQWDEAGRVDDEPMVAKWARMDLNTRLYGASFATSKWMYKTDSNGKVLFDGPTLKVLNPYDCLPNPSYSSIKNWFQYRDYVTLDELRNINDKSRQKSTYKNLDLLSKALQEDARATGDTRDSNYQPENRVLSKLQDFLGKDESPEFRTVEIVTEYQDDRVIVFCPKHGVIIRDDTNPYDHKQIPVLILKYIPIDDDIYGLSEIDPVEKIQKALNAITSQYLDAINMDLYRIVKVNPQNVQMSTFKWGPGEVWKMNNPATDAIPLETSMAPTSKFMDTYSVLTGMFREAMGETSGAFSALNPGDSKKTATEIQSTQTTRTIRDNFNQVFLSEAIKKQMMLWLLMNKQFIFADPSKQLVPLRILGRDTMQQMQGLGLDAQIPNTSPEEMLMQETNILEGQQPDIQNQPQYPVNVDGQVQSKFTMDKSGEYGTVYMTPEDMTGNYDYVADVQPMQTASTQEETRGLQDAVTLIANPVVLQLLQAEGKQPKMSEMLIDLYDRKGIKGSEKYFEAAPQMQPQGGLNGANATGAGASQAGGMPSANQGF